MSPVVENIANIYEVPARTVDEVIDGCARLIERNAITAGVGNQMRHPLLSIFQGRQAVAHIPTVEATYFSCWSAQARRLKLLHGITSPSEVENAVWEAGRDEGQYTDRTAVRVVWYWDIMDDDFDQQFELIKSEFRTPVGVSLKQSLFIFCSQKNAEGQNKTEARLKEIIAWAEEKRQPLVVMSDGVLSAKGIAESYHLSASLVLLINSASPIGDSVDLGAHLDHAMGDNTVWTAGYHACSKNSFDIIGVSLLKILEEYRETGNTQKQYDSVQNCLCGSGKNYNDFLSEVFENVLVPRCPADEEIKFWEDLPYTAEIASWEQSRTDSGAARGGLFGFFKKGSRGANVYSAIASVQDVWDSCVKVYYTEPILTWLKSEEGAQAVSEYIYGRLTSVLTLGDIRTKLPEECAKLKGEEYLCPTFAQPELRSELSAAGCFHACACACAREQAHDMLLRYLVGIMESLIVNADGFGPLLDSVADSLRGLQMDEYIKRAYGNHMEKLAEANRDILIKKIRPCNQEQELLCQLEAAFRELVDADPERVYYYTLKEHIDFLIKRAQAGESDVVATCFAYDMANAGRLYTYGAAKGGRLYCIMNNALQTLIQDVDSQYIGERFISNRSDRIERLYIYPVDPDRIMYH